MGNSREVLEKNMKFVLQYVDETNKLPSRSQEILIAIKECVDANFLDNVSIVVFLDDSIRAISSHPRVSRKGLEFLYPDPSPRKGDGPDEPSESHAAKGQSDASKQSLHWTKLGVVSAIILGVAAITVSIVIWILS